MILKAGNRLLRYNSTHFGYAIKDLITFGSFAGANKWIGGVLAPNGKIYGIPYNSTQVLEIDPVTQTTTLFGSLSGLEKWRGGVLAPNGKIYGIPASSTQVLEIDPVTQTTTLFGSLAGSSKWIGGVLAPNGKIYGIPFSITQVLQYYTKSFPNIVDMVIPQDLADLKTSKYNQYHNKY